MLVLVAIFQIFMKLICHLLSQGNSELAELTSAYLTPLVFVGPILMLIMGMAQFVRTDGNPKMAAWISLLANGVNVLLNYVFIGYLGMGMFGAGLATVLGYGAGIFMLLPYLFSKKRTLRFVRLKWGDLKKAVDILRIGLPKGLNQGLNFLRTAILNTMIVAALGSLGMAAMTLCVNVMMLANMFINGSNDTLLPIIGTLYGEKDTAGIKFAARRGFQVMIFAVIVLTAVFVIAPGLIATMFGVVSLEGKNVAESAVRIYALCLPFYGINLLLQNFYQTTGREKFASVIASLNGFVFVVSFAALLSAINGNFIWMAFVLSEAATLSVILIYGMMIRKKEGTAGFLLLENKTEAQLDISIPAAIQDAAKVSEQIIQFCRTDGVDGSGAMRMGVAAEEMAANIARYGHTRRRGVIDVLIRLWEGEVILRLRDDGAFFDPTQYTPEEEAGGNLAVGGIEVVRRLADKVEYSRQLGFNVTVITISREVLDK
jgi:Na+-driven multidrug efflux pump/anti-sigma regulatory factor (Ser/Thr protein kinase)